jgi:hypothetical protein
MPHLVATDSGGADWSPDSNEIVYGMSGTGIYVVNRDGTGTRLLHASDAGNVSEYDPSWSPDGRSLAFVRYVWKPVRAESVLMLMSADGTNARRAAGDWELGASEPAWRPARAADHGRPCFVRGSTRANRLVGTNAGDVLLGEGGNDILSGRGGNDLILGGPGHDVVRGGAGADWLYTPDDARDDVEGGTGYDRAEIDDKDKSSGVEQERPPW